MTDSIKLLNGVNGQLEVYPDKVIIKRKGAMSKLTQGFFKGDKSIYLKQITGIQVKDGGLLTNGYIQFIVAGSMESKRGLLDATKDENTVMFRKGDNSLVHEIKSYIEQQMSAPLGTVQPLSMADELRKLKSLVDDGILTQEEFDKKKKELLG